MIGSGVGASSAIGSNSLIVNDESAMNIEQALRSSTSHEDRQSLLSNAKCFLEGRKLGPYDVSDVIYALAPIDKDLRKELVEQAKALCHDIESVTYCCSILSEVGFIDQAERSHILLLAMPLVKRFSDPSIRSNILSLIRWVPKEVREKVVGEVPSQYPDYSWGSIVNMIQLHVARIYAQPVLPLEKLQIQKVKKSAHQEPISLLHSLVVKRKMQKVVKTIEQTKLQGLTSEEFYFLANRSIGLRFSEQADKEFIHGLDGDAVSLSGYPLAQSQFIRGRRSSFEWQNFITTSDDPAEGAKVLEERIQQTILKFLGNGFPNYGKEVKTCDYLELLELRNSAKFLLANFKDADMPYDIGAYYGLGKCGKQRLGSTSDKKGQGRLIKCIMLDDGFFRNSAISKEERELPIDQTFRKIMLLAAQNIQMQVIMQIRKMYLLAKVFPD